MSGGRCVWIVVGAACMAAACGARTGLVDEERAAPTLPDGGQTGQCFPGESESCVGQNRCPGTRTCDERGIWRACQCTPAGCSDRSFTSDPHPLSVYLMIDTSGSMQGDRWTSAKNAIERFVADPAIAGLQVGLGLFPVNGELLCPIELYSRPVVPFGPLTAQPVSSDPQERAVVDALARVTPLGGTPTFGALIGALSIARARANVVPPEEQVIVVFVTDGLPTSCDVIDLQVAEPARVEFNKKPPIRTFVIGLEVAHERFIDAIAAAGGGKAFHTREGDVASRLLGALADIKGFLPCSFEAPPAAADPRTPIAVTLIGSSGAVDLQRVPDIEACGAADAFYVDATAGRTEIRLCPDSCTRANSVGISQLRLRVGCD